MDVIEINGITFTMDVLNATVSYTYEGVDFVVFCGDFHHFLRQKQIVVTPKLSKFVMGNKLSAEDLDNLIFDNTNRTKSGYPLYDAFFAQTDLSGIKIMKALINTYLESAHFQEIALQKAACYDPEDGWTFKHPLQISATTQAVSSEGESDGSISVQVIKPNTGTYQIKVADTNYVLVHDYINGLQSFNLAAGAYKVKVLNLDVNYESSYVDVLIQ